MKKNHCSCNCGCNDNIPCLEEMYTDIYTYLEKNNCYCNGLIDKITCPYLMDMYIPAAAIVCGYNIENIEMTTNSITIESQDIIPFNYYSSNDVVAGSDGVTLLGGVPAIMAINLIFYRLQAFSTDPSISFLQAVVHLVVLRNDKIYYFKFLNAQTDDPDQVNFNHTIVIDLFPEDIIKLYDGRGDPHGGLNIIGADRPMPNTFSMSLILRP
ncbi:MAG: hypothetical protein Hyperionvirus34_25 [Hyperionvirus sp.]|uniref:Uncharacterized protein n=1 Tax=Hyperionvirus sp. TaxID=2487770 RepID=A0A3G5AEK0_9VIRU|nr:MAG: hypothetical protein Hyperionvirus34_25 [Hyperionvirus sp.]